MPQGAEGQRGTSGNLKLRVMLPECYCSAKSIALQSEGHICLAGSHPVVQTTVLLTGWHQTQSKVCSDTSPASNHEYR